ncbi:MAG: carboxypeptidase-like regulatory domain-containing protein, partial [Ferruginibacter sp.]
MKRSPILLWLFFAMPSFIFSQSRQITGSVLDQKGLPVPLATIEQKSTNNAVTAKEDGTFAITLDGKILKIVVSSVNFKSQEISVTSENTYRIVLQEGA